MGILRGVVRKLVGAVALLAMLIGVPVMSVVLVGWPLPTYVPDPGDVLLAIEQGNVPSTFVVKALAVVLWIVWAQFAWATLWEIAVNIRRTERGERTTKAPLVSNGLQSGVSRLVASLFVAGVIAAPTASSFVPLGPPAAHASPEPAPSQMVSSLGTENAVSARQPRWLVNDGDTLWGIAEAALGDGSRVGEILELNPTLGSPRALRVGMQLTLPAGSTIPADRTGPGAAAASTDEYLPAAGITIVRGDNLWELSEDRLELASGEEPSPGTTVSYLRAVIDANATVIEDPNLIFPGEVFTFPSIGEPPAPTYEAPDPLPTPRPVPVTTAVPDSVPDAAPPVSVATTIPAVAPATTVATSAVSAQTSESPRSSNERWVVTAAVSTLLAGSLVASVRRVRIRRSGRSMKGAALSHLYGSEAVLMRRSDRMFTEWIATLLAEVAAHAAATGFGGVPVAIELDGHEIELLWDRPHLNSIAPWKVTADGWAWQASFGVDEYEATCELQPCESRAVPALVTIGKRDGRDLVVDLEALGAVTVIGDQTAAIDLVRSMAIELGDGDGLSNAQVVLVGFDLALDEHLRRVSTKTDAVALGLMSTLVEQHRQVMERADVATTFQLRGVPPFGREATVFIVNAARPNRIDEMLALVEPGLPVSVVVVASSPMTEAVIDVESAERATIAPLGVEFIPAGFAARTAEMLADQLDALAAAGEPPVEVASLEGILERVDVPDVPGVEEVDPTADREEQPEIAELVLFPAGETTSDAPPLGAEPTTDNRPDDRTLIRVLGVPRVEHPATLGQRDVSLLAFVACSGGSATEDQVIDAVWSGKTMSKQGFYNRLSKVRSALNGVLALRDKCDPRVRVEGVATDLQLMSELVDRAVDESSGDELELLVEALSWIEGRPFDAAGFEWAYAHQFHAEVTDIIEKATLRLVDLALGADDATTGRYAVTQALKALPLHESIYRAKMRVEAAADNLTGVRKAYDELALLLDDLDDGYQPSTETTRLLRELTKGRRSA